MFVSSKVIKLFSFCNSNVGYLLTPVLGTWCVGFFSVWSTSLPLSNLMLHLFFVGSQTWCIVTKLLFLTTTLLGCLLGIYLTKTLDLPWYGFCDRTIFCHAL